jgi:hypothetical protein
MSKSNIDQLIVRLENYLECWKQFNTFMTMARNKKFTQEDENQFLEIKSVLAQELELILASRLWPIAAKTFTNLIAPRRPSATWAR